MLRRNFIKAIGCTIIALDQCAVAQTKVWRIGHLYPGRQEVADGVYWDAFRDELRKLGYIEGHNLIIDYNYADGKIDRPPAVATELVSRSSRVPTR